MRLYALTIWARKQDSDGATIAGAGFARRLGATAVYSLPYRACVTALILWSLFNSIWALVVGGGGARAAGATGRVHSWGVSNVWPKVRVRFDVMFVFLGAFGTRPLFV